MKIRLIPVLLSFTLICTSCAAENTGKVSSHTLLSNSSITSIASPSSTVDSNQSGVSRSLQGASNINISRSVSSNSNNSLWPSNQKPLSSSEVQTAQNAFSDKLSRIANTKNISKVEMASGNMVAGGRMKEYTLDSTDPGTISAWVSLLKQMKVSTAKYAIVIGAPGYKLSFFVNGKEVTIGSGFKDGYIYADSERFMYVIDNFDTLKGEFKALQKKMGFPKYK